MGPWGMHPMPPRNPFWGIHCPERGNGTLTHRHDPDCKDGYTHPETGERHRDEQCCSCGHTPESWERRVIEKVADPDSMPLAIQPAGCQFAHESRARLTPLIGENGLEWPTCPFCHVYIEPKLATGGPIGQPDGIGRGWVSPRTKARWNNIAYQLRRKARTRFTRNGRERRAAR